MTTTTKVTARRQRSMTEEAAQAAVDQACRRLRLPTMAGVEPLGRQWGQERLLEQGLLA